MVSPPSVLQDGDLLPAMRCPPLGPRARDNCRRLAACEAPGINTLGFGPAIQWLEARGANVLDVDGNVYVDLTAGFGVAAIGHRHPRVTAAVAAQSQRLVHALGDVHAHPGRIELAERLSALLPVAAGNGSRDTRIHFAVSGADAVEIALKTALLYSQQQEKSRQKGKGGRPGVLVFDPAYHGLTLGALAATSRPAFRQPFDSWLHPCVERLPFGVDPDVLDQRLQDRTETPAIGCVLVEPWVGREGVLIPPRGWLAQVARACRQRDVLLIADEIFTGFGRTGTLFAVESEGVEPDLLCCGKALGGGLPIAATAGRAELMEVWQTSGEALHTGTFVAHPLACAAALATLDVLHEEDLVARAQRLGEFVAARVQSWPRRFPAVRQVRGRGLMWGVEFEQHTLAGRWSDAALHSGVLLLAGGPEGRVAELTPPLSITEAQLETALDLLQAELERW